MTAQETINTNNLNTEDDLLTTARLKTNTEKDFAKIV